MNEQSNLGDESIKNAKTKDTDSVKDSAINTLLTELFNDRIKNTTAQSSGRTEKPSNGEDSSIPARPIESHRHAGLPEITIPDSTPLPSNRPGRLPEITIPDNSGRTPLPSDRPDRLPEITIPDNSGRPPLPSNRPGRLPEITIPDNSGRSPLPPIWTSRLPDIKQPDNSGRTEIPPTLPGGLPQVTLPPDRSQHGDPTRTPDRTSGLENGIGRDVPEWMKQKGDKITIQDGKETLRTASGDQITLNKDGTYEIKGKVDSVKTNEKGETTVEFADGHQVKFDKEGFRDKNDDILAQVADKATLDKLAKSIDKGEGFEDLQKIAKEMLEKGGADAVMKLVNKINKRLDAMGSQHSLERLILNAGFEPWGTVLNDDVRLVKKGESVLDAPRVISLMKENRYGRDRY